MNLQIGTVLLSILCAAALLSGCGSTSGKPHPTEEHSFQVMSFNIRYNNPDDGIHAWPNRRNRVAALIRFHETDLLGVQEALKGQIDDLDRRLPNFDWFGVGRGDEADQGEFSAIFYRSNRFELLHHDTFWLSPTPEVPGSQGWDAALPRIVTWGEFRDRRTGSRFYHFNTHFDHRGETARLRSAELLTTRIDSIADTTTTLVTGDFNLTDDSKPYEILTRSLKDTHHTSITDHYGPQSTYYGFELSEEPGPRIDYIFGKNGVTTLRHGTLTDNWQGAYPSDHLPVLAEVRVHVDAE
jgi:endonuclease/exonuclease/phosphatase family metal-dependent hydrolase